MNAAHLVDRMMQSLSAKALTTPIIVDKYLQVFGVTTVSKELPLVFDQQYANTWKAFCVDCTFLNRDPKVRLLLTILEYVKYMRQQRLNPFVVTNGVNMNKTIRPVDMSNDVSKVVVQEVYTTVMNYLRKSGVTSYLSMNNRVVQTSLDKSAILLNFSFIPLRKEPLEQIIYHDLKGLLYKVNCPIQLQTQRPVNGKTFRVTITTLNTSVSDWLPLISINNFKIFARATKDALAIRVVIPVDKDFVRTPRELNTLTSLYKTVK